MGDTTFNHIFGGQESTAGVSNQASPVLSPADLDGLFKRADKATTILRSAIKAHRVSPGTLAKLKILSPYDIEGL